MDLQQICPTYVEEEPVINAAYAVPNSNQMMSPPMPQQPVVPYLENDYFA